MKYVHIFQSFTSCPGLLTPNRSFKQAKYRGEKVDLSVCPTKLTRSPSHL